MHVIPQAVAFQKFGQVGAGVYDILVSIIACVA